MSENKRFIKSANLNAEDGISPIDRWILACLVKGLQGTGDISKISVDTIAKYCQYTDKDDNTKVFGRKAVQAAIERLEKAGKITILKPQKKGQCTRYKITKIPHFEKLNEEFFNLNIPPLVKGYLLCALQHNLNRNNDTYEPNSTNTKTTWNISDLSREYNMPVSSIYKAEKFLKDNGILTIQQDPNMKRDKETGLIIQNRSIDLNKIGLDEFVVITLGDHEGRIQDVESKVKEKVDKKDVAEIVRNEMEKFKDDFLTKFLAKEPNTI